MKVESKLRKHFEFLELDFLAPFFDAKDPVIVYNKGGNIFIKPNKPGTLFRFKVELQDALFHEKIKAVDGLSRGVQAFRDARSKIERAMVRYENNIYKKMNLEGYNGYWTTHFKGDAEVTLKPAKYHIDVYAWYKIGVFVVKA